MSGEWFDTSRAKTDVGWNMPYFTTAKYGWETREPISKMLTDIVDNTSEDPDLIADIHKIASEIMYPTDQTTGKDSRYLSTMKEYLCNAFWHLDLDRSHTEYVGPGAEPYDWDESCEDEIIAIWNSIDPTVMRANIYRAFMKLAYGGWINYDKVINGAAVPKDILSSNIKRVTVHGTENGCGSLSISKNYLKQRTTPIPNGCIGTFAGNIHARAAITGGYTFNTGNATTIYGTFNDGGTGNVTPANMGDLMLVEGTTIPSAYDADTNLYKDSLYQGTTYYQDYDNGIVVGASQIMYCGTDQFGRTNTFIDNMWNERVVHINPITVKPNTDYSIRLFNSSYPNATLWLGAVTAPGTITPQFIALSGQKSIPANGSFVTNTEQWIDLGYQYYDRLRSRVGMPIDLRPIRYEFCESFADLKAGTYKLMIDEWGNNSSGDWICFSGYTGCYEDNWNGEQSGIYEWFALVKEDNTPVISKTRLFDASMDDYQNRRSKTPPYPNYFHKEVEFTLTEDTKVGLMHKAYYRSVTYAYPPYFRFYIVDADEEAEEFTTTGVSPANMSGYSAWEPYHQICTITVNFTNKFTGESDSITTEVQDMLYSNDSFYITPSLECETGIVTVDILERDSEDPTITPTVDISYS